jgi:hypothetical protein
MTQSAAAMSQLDLARGPVVACEEEIGTAVYTVISSEVSFASGQRVDRLCTHLCVR